MVLLAASTGMSEALKLALQVPPTCTVAVWLDVPQVTVTVRPASAVVTPETATEAAFSTELITLSEATVLMLRVGGVVSICTLRVACVAGLPAASLTLAVMVLLAVSAGTSLLA